MHGANETSEGLVRNVARIEDQVRARGWDVRVVAPEWRRHSGLRLGNWKKAIHRRGRPSPMPVPVLKAGLRKDAVMRIATNYFEDRREALFDILGPQMMADVIGYQSHRDSIQRVLAAELTSAAKGAQGRPVLPVALSLGGIALVDLLASWPDAPVEACVTVGSQAPLLYTFDAIPSMPYDEASPPYLPVPWLNIYDSRDFLSFLAEPLFRRTDGLASVVDLRVHSGQGLPGIAQRVLGIGAGLGRHRHGVQLATDAGADRGRGATARLRGAQGAGRKGIRSGRVRGAAAERDPVGGRGVLSGRRRLPRAAPRGQHRGSWSPVRIAAHARSVGPPRSTSCFGNPATSERPVALRPRLATGLPLSIGQPRGDDVVRRP